MQKSRNFTAALLSASIMIAPLAAAADSGFVGGLVGGVIGSALLNSSNAKVRTKKRRSGVSSATRAANREVQTSLNYFGFPAGTPDGVLGRRSRAAVSQFQAHMGYPVTGRLPQYERDFLVGSYYRAQSGGPTTAELIASNPQGVRGLLIVYRDEQMNGSSGATRSIAGHYGLPKVVAAAVNEIAKSSDPSAEQLVQRSGFLQLSDINGDGQTDYILDTSVTGSAFWCNAQSCQVRVFASTPNGHHRNDFLAFNVTPAMFDCLGGSCRKIDAPVMATAPAPVPQANTQPKVQQAATAPVPTAIPSVRSDPQPTPAAAGLSMLNFSGTVDVAPSMASHCNSVSLRSATNGGFTTLATLRDPKVALSEQMCLARTYAMSNGEELMSRVNGVTPAQIVAQCEGLGPVLSGHVAAVSLQEPGEVLRAVSAFVLGSGMPTAQLSFSAKLCLSVGYKRDDMDVAVGALLLLVALGEAPYSELVGHHLHQGFGATQRDDLAMQWFDRAFNALASGSQAVFAPGQPERTALLIRATQMLNAGGTADVATTQTAVKAAGMPLFSFSE